MPISLWDKQNKQGHRKRTKQDVPSFCQPTRDCHKYITAIIEMFKMQSGAPICCTASVMTFQKWGQPVISRLGPRDNRRPEFRRFFYRGAPGCRTGGQFALLPSVAPQHTEKLKKCIHAAHIVRTAHPSRPLHTDSCKSGCQNHC
jgi:hypothetical protein